jgi:thiosulfate dehydrogenase
MQKMNKVIFPAAFALSVLISLSGAGETDAQERLPIGYQLADLKAGGLLYDNWLKLKGIKINNTHPMFPDDKKKNGVTSWRCKECHGWDYLGKEGCYHDNHVSYVGIKGVYDVRNRSPEELYFAIADRDEHHDFKKYLRLSASDIWSLVKFIREGLVDFRKVMNPDRSINGDPKKGRIFYWQHCAECHGGDGNKILSREELEGAHGVGWEANADPQETLHKIRWGHPGTDMPSAIIDKGLSDQDTIDILSYCQQLYP